MVGCEHDLRSTLDGCSHLRRHDVARRRIQAIERLIQQQQPPVHDQRPGHERTPQLAIGKLPRAAPAEAAQPDFRESATCQRTLSGPRRLVEADARMQA
jgi:hypothetical protein